MCTKIDKVLPVATDIETRAPFSALAVNNPTQALYWPLAANGNIVGLRGTFSGRLATYNKQKEGGIA